MLGEFGAEVIKVEQPGAGDPLRTWGDQEGRRRPRVEERQPQQATASHSTSVALTARSCATGCSTSATCSSSGNRPSALLRWGLDYESVHGRHPRLVMLHVSGYGRGGPWSDRPGFGTLAEAMSGFAQVTGQPDGPPTLPPFMLADGVAAQAATWAVMMALYHRDVRGGSGQLVDVNLVEPLARLIESSTLSFDQLGIAPVRSGNHLAASAPRNAYRTADGKWLAISSASSNIVVRVFRSIGRPDLAIDHDYVDPVGRQERGLEIDAMVAEWVAERTLDEAMRVFLDAEVAAAPVYDAEQLLADEHLRSRGTFPRIADADLGSVSVQAPVAQLSETPGRIDHLGQALGAENDAVYGGILGIEPDRIAALRAAGTI